MKKAFCLVVVAATLVLNCCAAPVQNDPPLNWLKKTTDVIAFQLNKAAQTYKPGKNPRSVNPNGPLR